jgi:hypothetical protein
MRSFALARDLLKQAEEKDAQLALGEYQGWLHSFPQAIKDLPIRTGLSPSSRSRCPASSRTGPNEIAGPSMGSLGGFTLFFTQFCLTEPERGRRAQQQLIRRPLRADWTSHH